MLAMEEAGYLTEEERGAKSVRRGCGAAASDDVPTGTYFADWVIPQATDLAEGSYGERQVVTTLDGDLQRFAVRAVRRAGLGRAQAALVAMRLDGSVVAMVGGRDYQRSAFNRATQAQPPAGLGVQTVRLLRRLPRRLHARRRRSTTRRSASATGSRAIMAIPIAAESTSARRSPSRATRWPCRCRSGSAATKVIRAARDLGITTPLRPDPSLALGANGVTLIELTAAYAAVAAGRYPIRPRGLPERARLVQLARPDEQLNRDRAFPMLRDVLYNVVQRGTGRSAALPVPTFGKTGTTSDYRDAWFIGFAGDLVVGVWVGNDDNRPLPGTSGGGVAGADLAQLHDRRAGPPLGPAAAARCRLSQTDRGPAAATPGQTTDPVPEPITPVRAKRRRPASRKFRTRPRHRPRRPS